MNSVALHQFLLDSNKSGYATGEENAWVKNPDGSTTIKFESGDWKSNDNFFGGEPYGGRALISYKNKPVWIMAYYGWVENDLLPDPIYVVLRNALKQMPDDAPYRGPKEYIEGRYIYSNTWEGNIERYSGTEQIMHDQKLVYRADYMGGLVDQRAGV